MHIENMQKIQQKLSLTHITLFTSKAIHAIAISHCIAYSIDAV